MPIEAPSAESTPGKNFRKLLNHGDIKSKYTVNPVFGQATAIFNAF
jgi:hypothetical protein